MNAKKIMLAFALATGLLSAISSTFAHHEVGKTSYLSDTNYITSVPGNFVAEDDDQICYNVFGDLGLGELRGFKIDPPVAGTYDAITVTLSNGKYLAWSAPSSLNVLAVVVKGGPNYTLYDYLHASLDASIQKPIPSQDLWLHSPLHKGKIPDISHFNFCYQVKAPGDQGCTPGYWRNHADRWTGALPSDYFDTTFNVTSGLGATYTLGQAAWAAGGGVLALARHGTAGLLNAYGGVPNGDGTTVAYAYTVAEVLSMVKTAIDSGDPALIESTKDLLAAANEAGCPLNGTSANPAPH
ncbi:hypothetical protein [Pseudomonas sp. Q1-7]|uniref:hypothetical protein n=1 Tax=Pseudomonas sp. Q1-7 TaxID=3020843 RepID=UPI0023014BB3|nr:hypothetical protein [Pseudomonas sp. Q1-7]